MVSFSSSHSFLSSNLCLFNSTVPANSVDSVDREIYNIGEAERLLFEKQEELSLYLWIMIIVLGFILFISLFALYRFRRLFKTIRVFRSSGAMPVASRANCTLIAIDNDEEKVIKSHRSSGKSDSLLVPFAKLQSHDKAAAEVAVLVCDPEVEQNAHVDMVVVPDNAQALVKTDADNDKVKVIAGKLKSDIEL